MFKNAEIKDKEKDKALSNFMFLLKSIMGYKIGRSTDIRKRKLGFGKFGNGLKSTKEN